MILIDVGLHCKKKTKKQKTKKPKKTNKKKNLIFIYYAVPE